MCKLLIMTGIQEGLLVQDFMRLMAVPMSKTNAHGIGYTGVGPDGELFSERWLNNDQFLDTKNVMTPKIARALAAYENRLPKGALEMNYSRMGDVDLSKAKTITMHTRYATCGREFANTHPFIDQDVSLIHNGGIRNAFTTQYTKGLDVNKISTCDSEAALQTYLSQGVAHDTAKAKEWLDILSGTWAFGVLARNKQGNRILDVVRGTSFLYYMEIEGLGKVFTTDDDDAKAVVKEMGLKFVKEPILVLHNEMYRYDALTGEFLETVDIKPVYKTYGSSNSKTGGSTTTGTSSSRTNNQSSQRKRNNNGAAQKLLDLVDMFRDDPDAMSLLPDIFTDKSSPKNLKVCTHKVAKHCNDLSLPILDRLDIFDLVFNTDFVDKYESMPPQLREYIKEVDNNQGLKAARVLLNQLYEKKSITAG